MHMFENGERRINWWSASSTTSTTTTPVVFLHAFPLASSMWKPQVDLQECGIDVFACDLYGFGGSDASDDPADYSIDALAGDLHRFLAEVVKRPAVICGLSLGGYIALRAAIVDSSLMSGLILADVGAGSDEPEAFHKEVEAWAAAYEASDVDAFLERLLQDPLFGDSRTLGADVFDAIVDTIRTNPKSGVIQTARHVIAGRTPVYSLEVAMQGLDIPTLVMVGGSDDKCLRPAAFLARTIPGARLETFQDCGHFINVERSARFNALLDEFVRSLKTDDR